MTLALAAEPKAELHLHLEGSIRPATLLALAPHLDADGIRARYRYRDFAGFLDAYKWTTAFLREPAHFQRIAAALLDELAAQGVVYVELNLSAGVMLLRQQDVEAMFTGIEEAVAAQPIRVRYLFDAVRQFGPEHAQEVAEWAVRLKHRGVLGFGLGGDEARGPVPLFRETIAYARANGLRFVPHAGETTGPETIWQSLEEGAERIGHGIRAVDDPVLVRHLADRQIPLEVCPTSNIATGVTATMEEHPLRRLYDAGVPIVINSDDPAMFHTTLLEEYALAGRAIGLSGLQLHALARQSLRWGFDPPPGYAAHFRASEPAR